MLSRKNRFHGPNAVRRIRGSNVHTEHLSARASKNSKLSDYRLAIVVSKKTAAKAVTRNRIRRRLFEAVRIQVELKNQPLDCVIYVKSPELAAMAPEVLSAEVAQLTQKIVVRMLH